MTAVHYATYFDVAPVLTILLHRTKVSRINLCPYASKYWRFKSFILHFISPFTITHLFKMITHLLFFFTHIYFI